MNQPPPEQPSPAEEEPQESILGSLPRSRPSVRSPRRDEAAKARARRAAARKTTARGAGDGPKRRASPRAEPAPEPEGVGGVDDLARAGVTTAVQVATAGLRFAGRAAGAIRESLERR